MFSSNTLIWKRFGESQGRLKQFMESFRGSWGRFMVFQGVLEACQGIQNGRWGRLRVLQEVEGALRRC